MKVALDPIIPSPEIEQELEREIIGWFREVLFQPLFDEFEHERNNFVQDNPALTAALYGGQVSYANGVFFGEFNSAISLELRKIGAKFNPTKKTFALAISDTPYSLRGAIAASQERSKSIHDRIILLLGLIAAGVLASKVLGFDLEKPARQMVSEYDRQFAASVKAATEESTEYEMAVLPPVSDQIVRQVRENLTESLAYPIKDFTKEETVELRLLVEENWREGGRLDRLQEIIQERFEVSERKAAFLARQETSMMAAQFARVRAQAIGSTDYIWFTRHDERVRPDHRLLDGTVQEWDNPPVNDRARGIHGHPGEGPNCRCVSRPLINLQAKRKAA
jgi:SPP1 gp7 family putative phage head morphogenesis protein